MKQELLVQVILRFKDDTYTVVVSPLDHLDATLDAANRNASVSHYELHGIVQGHENADVVLAALRENCVHNELVAVWLRMELLGALAVLVENALQVNVEIDHISGFDYEQMRDFSQLLTTLRIGLSV